VAREHGAALVVLAVPVAPKGWERNFVGVADHCACLETPTHFHAVGLHYKDFSPTSDAQVQSHLEDQQLAEQHLTIESDGSLVQGVITSPASTASRGLVVFAHGTGSSHRNPRNRFVARHLTAAGFTAALFDLVAADEGLDGGNDFDLPKLTERLLHMTWSLQQRPALAGQPLGFFGASTGAAVALGAAARLGDAVGAIVARGGRPDLARSALGQVTAPTLLVVGAADPEVVELNERARGELTCRVQLHVVPGATHVFAEPGALDAVADLTARWFGRYLPR
jgi:dienelactone hydrolase